MDSDGNRSHECASCPRAAKASRTTPENSHATRTLTPTPLAAAGVVPASELVLVRTSNYQSSVRPTPTNCLSRYQTIRGKSNRGRRAEHVSHPSVPIQSSATAHPHHRLPGRSWLHQFKKWFAQSVGTQADARLALRIPCPLRPSVLVRSDRDQRHHTATHALVQITPLLPNLYIAHVISPSIIPRGWVCQPQAPQTTQKTSAQKAK